ncbi:LPXTG cell wall anchor domain-containing protein [Bacillus sp. AFS040349]|uniref:LPXTG cell wall anchor domain-containing protein n=1 Tax=Bacillus sp. AFS040349 TaxID=2033502 RepID=UPI000BFCE80B|nr:LPXTG cell wall anchor domain-containing protein [Bacillus sp. AFS040349]PGT89628.1 hypothetical protein COD11_03740 [Bacillus sp. AFS040349]
MFVDNVRFDKASAPGTGDGNEETPAQPGTGENEGQTPDPTDGDEASKDPVATPVKDKEKAEEKDKDNKGEKLPKTATNSFNTLLIGGLVLLVGAGSYFYLRRRAKLEQE